MVVDDVTGGQLVGHAVLGRQVRLDELLEGQHAAVHASVLGHVDLQQLLQRAVRVRVQC